MAEGEEGPTLKLIMEKGPLAGQTRDFRSGSQVKIGRVVRGNTLTIKDDGISSKHISINFDSQPGRVGNWTISDLGSSNGTVLNGQTLEPFALAQLSDGDVIKIGEWTLIIVKFEDVRVAMEESKVGRNPPRRRGRNLGVVDENNEITLGKYDENKENVRGRIRRGKAAAQNSEFADGKEFNVGGMVRSKRVTGSSARNRNGVEGKGGEMEDLGRKACSRRNGRKEEKLEENGVQDVEETEHLGQNGVQEGENCNETDVGMEAKGMQEESLKRAGRSMKQEQNLEILDENGLQKSEAMEMFLPIEVKDGENVSLRRTGRSLRKEGNLENLGESVGVNNKMRRLRRGRRNVGMETLKENDEGSEMAKEKEVVGKLSSEREVLEEVKENLQVNGRLQEEGRGLGGLVEEGVAFVAAGCEGLASTSGFKENDGNEVDLEKITLGEWFDYLAVHLPKQIIDATEEMILEMRQKASKFHGFMLQQRNCKINVELPVG